MQAALGQVSSDSAIAKGASIGAGSAVRSVTDRYLQIGRLVTYQAASITVIVMNQAYSQVTMNTENNFFEFAVVTFGNYSDCFYHIVALSLGQVNVTWVVADLAKKMAKVSPPRFHVDSAQQKVFHAITLLNCD